MRGSSLPLTACWWIKKDARLEDTRRKSGELGLGFARGKRGIHFLIRNPGRCPGLWYFAPLGLRAIPRVPRSLVHNPRSAIRNPQSTVKRSQIWSLSPPRAWKGMGISGWLRWRSRTGRAEPARSVDATDEGEVKMERESIAKEFTKPVHLTPLATSGRIEPSPPYRLDMSPDSIRSMTVSSINGL